MPDVCFYFEVHQPYRLRPYRVFDVGHDHAYFDTDLNRSIFERIAKDCYLPANALIERLIARTEGRFRVAFSITGIAVEQMKAFAPEVLESFRRLVATGAVELLAETYHHSLASLYDAVELEEQVKKQVTLMERELGQRPTVFRNTELVYDDALGRVAGDLGFRAVLAEGTDDALDWRSPNYVYRVPGRETRLLLKNYRLSDDIAFRFGNPAWPAYPLTADRYAEWLHRIGGDAQVVGLFMDYETFGEHQKAETGIFQFLDYLPEAVLAHPDWGFRTPSEVIDAHEPVGELSFPRTVSWADEARDLSAWAGNEMQRKALETAFALGERVRRRNNPALLETWRRLLSSDHFYYMCNKGFDDGEVHDYFSPFESPYEAFIPYMSALRDLEMSILGPLEPDPPGAHP